MGAAGFAIDTDSLTELKLSDSAVSYSDNPDVLVFANDGKELEAIEYVAKLQGEGVKAQFSVLPTLEETEEFARQRKIPKVISI